MTFQIYRILHLVITGLLTIPISLFMASGGIGENFTDNIFPRPAGLSPILIWIIGSILSFVKKTAIVGLIISALPPIFFISIIIFNL